MQITKLLTDFREELDSIGNHGGMLSSEVCQFICSSLSIDLKTLMIDLLAVAESYSHSPVSDFKVGAIALGDLKSNGYGDLFFGSNLEIQGVSLGNTLHAEQSAVINAWMNGQSTTAIAISEIPCGHCRQFMFELSKAEELPIYLPDSKMSKINRPDLLLSQLLPAAFKPADLQNNNSGLSVDQTEKNTPKLQGDNSDEAVAMALKLASECYAPYTQNLAGCVIITDDDNSYFGKTLENAAYNPSVLAFTVALNQLRLSGRENAFESIARVVLVEAQGKVSQKQATQTLLENCCRQSSFDYHPALI
ncbi:MAG: cytidine deaminase [Gammaproteobacteria bacterium]|nr:cytidine deaminase [Gammaproteobacteria bacterium]MDH5628764.1 cytidine deaminase [Gammaproteobacteria bacterium]